MSNTFYNLGLMKAQNRDLTGAAEELERSLKLNKRNTKARNLLGLVYYEMGETVQALSEWVLSQNFDPNNNIANVYMRKIQSSGNRIEETKRNIENFNTALKLAQKGVYDIALIQLKKVVNQNPKLIKGRQLLALLFMRAEQYERARRELKQALAIDQCNPLTLRYLREVEELIGREKKSSDKKLNDPLLDRKALSGDAVIVPPHPFREVTNGAVTILNVVIGLVLGALAMYFLVTPIKVQNEVDKNNDLVLTYNQKLAIKNSSISELERQVESLTEEKETLEKKLEKSTNTKESVLNNYNYLISALSATIDEDVDTAAENLEKINSKTKMNSDVFDAVYKSLSESLKQEIADSYYEKGKEAYNQGNLEEAIEAYKKCLDTDDTYSEAMYGLGCAYYANGDQEKATKTFKKVIDKYPNTNAATEAAVFVPDYTGSSDDGNSTTE
jgi:tetratricopeptide (TPR) repeat protein